MILSCGNTNRSVNKMGHTLCTEMNHRMTSNKTFWEE